MTFSLGYLANYLKKEGKNKKLKKENRLLEKEITKKTDLIK